MDLLEHSVRFAEEFMGEPFPIRFAGILFKKAALTAEGSAGANFGNVSSILPQYDVDDDSTVARRTAHVMAHEIAHYYWTGRNQTWVKEGAAEFMATMSEHARKDAPVIAANPPCAYMSSIAALERLSPQIPRGGGPWGAYSCNYSLGERLFLDLHHVLGDEEFRRGSRNLYLMLERQNVGIDEVSRAFKADRDDAIAAAVDTIIARWFDGTAAYDISRLDDAPAEPVLADWGGRITDSFISLDPEWPVKSRVNQFSIADHDGSVYVWLQFYLPATSEPKIIPLKYVEFYEDGLVYRSSAITATFNRDWTRGWSRVNIGNLPGHQWATGKHGVQVYVDDQKVAELPYEVVP